MNMELFFLKNTRSEGFLQSLSPEEKAALDQYLYEMNLGPADGEMDIKWQETGKGYYVHLVNLQEIGDQEGRSDYLKRLKEDVKLWLVEDPKNYMVQRVQEILGERYGTNSSEEGNKH